MDVEFKSAKDFWKWNGRMSNGLYWKPVDNDFRAPRTVRPPHNIEFPSSAKKVFRAIDKKPTAYWGNLFGTSLSVTKADLATWETRKTQLEAMAEYQGRRPTKKPRPYYVQSQAMIKLKREFIDHSIDCRKWWIEHHQLILRGQAAFWLDSSMVGAIKKLAVYEEDGAPIEEDRSSKGAKEAQESEEEEEEHGPEKGPTREEEDGPPREEEDGSSKEDTNKDQDQDQEDNDDEEEEDNVEEENEEPDRIEYMALVWIEENKMLEMELDPEWVRERLTISLLEDTPFDGYKKVTASHLLENLTLKEFPKLKWTKDCVILENRSGCKIKVPTQWAKDNFPNFLINKSKDCGDFVRIRAGSKAKIGRADDVPSGLTPVPGHLRDSTYPLPYYNSNGQCVPLAVALGLRHIGFTAAAEQLVAMSRNHPELYLGDKQPLEVCKSLAKQILKPMKFHIYYKKTKGRGNFLQGGVTTPVIAKIKAVNGKQTEETNHVVCFVDDYVLDSNMDYAMKVSKASMDLISETVCGYPYSGVAWSKEIEVVPFSKGRKQYLKCR